MKTQKIQSRDYSDVIYLCVPELKGKEISQMNLFVSYTHVQLFIWVFLF